MRSRLNTNNHIIKCGKNKEDKRYDYLGKLMKPTISR